MKRLALLFKKMTFKIVVILLSLIGLLGCPEPAEEYDIELRIVNNSNISIVHLRDLTFDNIIDTVFYNGNNVMNDVDKYTIHSMQEIKIGLYRDVLESHLQNGKYLIYFFDREVVDSLSWQKISDEYLVLKRVDIRRIEDLEQMNWTIEYP